MKTLTLKFVSYSILLVGLFCIFILPVYLTRGIPAISGYLFGVSLYVAIFMAFEGSNYESKVSKNIESINKSSKLGDFILKSIIILGVLAVIGFYIWMFWAMFMHIYYLFV